jgi:hypothetical protein
MIPSTNLDANKCIQPLFTEETITGEMLSDITARRSSGVQRRKAIYLREGTKLDILRGVILSNFG